MSFLNQILTVPVTDPDGARRRKLLNILLLGVSTLCIITLIVVLSIYHLSQETSAMVYGSLAMLLGTVLIYLINRSPNSGYIASHLFLVLVTVVMALSDSPEQVATGRTLFSFSFPIIMASMLVGARASFAYAALCDAIIIGIAFRLRIDPNLPAVLGFLLIALIAWLSARSLEQVLTELRLMNRELDKRVAQQTLDLTKALTREREEAGRIHAILEGIADGVLVFDNQDQIIVANAALGRYLGTRPEEMIGKHFTDLSRLSELSPASNQDVTNLFDNPDQYKSNVRIQWGKFTFSLNASRVIDNNGEHIGKVAVFRDFTHEAEVENLKGIFLAMVSHELRTPLNAIQGYSEMLKEHAFGALTEKQNNIVTRIMNSTKRLLGLVNDLLDQAQIEAGKMKLVERQFQVQDLVEGLRGVMDPIVKDKGLTLSIEVGEGLPATLYGDPNRLQQILVNLVTNSIKFTETGGIWIRLFTPDPAHWVIEVKDTGIGIAPDQQGRIFDPFGQIEDLTTRQHGGIGLGLTIVKNLVTLMAGEIHLTSQPGHGTLFTIILPIKQA
ncbi:protein containg PAS domain S-box [Longilinea arvoryzae]|uniref:Circadian input-output histidine kinase CikA n=1 Tax=Longilinea arvoryzae TaxID=360412 RepID=A0A0S7BMV8_9CHLR|nr:PAS domain-containing sensor histidine kinase [Longilinea arvoryzae]GAP15066.1 protein containg PAS domain S-box [Longilinea arvoryzae]